MRSYTSTATRTWRTPKTAAQIIKQITITIMDKYDTKLGWFYNEPDWHESVIKLPASNFSDQRKMLIDWVSDLLGDDADDAIWYTTGRCMKIKFKSLEVKNAFEHRWSYSWKPENEQMTYYLPFSNQHFTSIESITKTFETKIGRRSVDWEFCATGLWFKNIAHRTKAKIMTNEHTNKLHSKLGKIILRPLSKSILCITPDGQRIEMNHRVSLHFLPPNDGTFTSQLGTFFAPSLPGLSDHSIEKQKVVEWCKQNLSKNSWTINDDYIYFTNDSDSVVFILRWL